MVSTLFLERTGMYKNDEINTLVIGRFDRFDKNFCFRYTKTVLKPEVERWFLPYGFPDINKKYVSEHLFPILYNRVMPKKRPDRPYILKLYGLENPSDFEYIARSGGVKVTDYYSLFEKPQVDDSGVFTVLFFPWGLIRTPIEVLNDFNHPVLGELQKVSWSNGSITNAKDDQIPILTENGILCGIVPPHLKRWILNPNIKLLDVSIEKKNLPPEYVECFQDMRVLYKATFQGNPCEGEEYETIVD